MKNKDRLIDAICCVYDKAWLFDSMTNTPPPYAPKDGTTFCNEAIIEIAHLVGCDDFAGRMANDIIDFMSASNKWQKVEMKDAQFTANLGSLVIAGQKAEGHGHVCVVRPGQAKWSAKWNCSVPSVMNIGKDCFISKGVNFSFQEPPDFYVWKDSL